MSVWSKIYERINWKDLPQRLTALAARNLNKMDLAIDTLDDRTIGLNTRLEAVEESQVSVDTELKPDSENPVQNKVIYAVFENLLPEETAQGNPISINDASGLDAKEVVVEFGPIQDLHGYGNPWIGGAGKNKYKIAATSKTESGCTMTISSDGIISCSGNATATIVFSLDAGFIYPAGSYIMNGCPSGGGSNKYKLDLPNSSYATDTGEGVSFTSNGTQGQYIRLVIYSGYGNGLVFKPMIRLATVTDDSFAPWENICPINGRTELNLTRTGKNLLENTATTNTLNGVTFTVNSDGTVVANGTASGNANFYVNGNSVKRFGQSIITGCPTGGSSTTYFIEFYDTENASYSCRDYGNGNNIQADANGDISRVVISIRNGYTANNLTFYPMIRLATETDATYEPYNGKTYTENLGATYYGGKVTWHADGSCTADIDKAIVDLSNVAFTYNSASTNLRWVMNSTLADAKNYGGVSVVPQILFEEYKTDSINNQNLDTSYVCGTIYNRKLYIRNGSDTTSPHGKCVYELATPTTLTLTAQQIALLKGNNVLWTDGDNIILKYSADIKAWVENQLSV